jgi:3-hydroxyacyl-[acyl-carrier-protein] dehydratase
MRWIWIDRFVSFESGKSATAIKNLSLAEDHFADHFPGYPVMPAPLILEGLAQTGGILVGDANNYTKNVVLAKIPKANFRRDALAGETLTYTTTLQQLSEIGGLVTGTVHSAEELIAEAEIFFAHVEPEQFKELTGSSDNFVFTGNLKNMVSLAKKV